MAVRIIVGVVVGAHYQGRNEGNSGSPPAFTLSSKGREGSGRTLVLSGQPNGDLAELVTERVGAEADAAFAPTHIASQETHG